MQDRVRIANRAAAATAAILLVGLFQGLGASPAAADAASDVTVASVTAAIGSGTTDQEIGIPADSALAGQSNSLVIMPDSGVAANGFGAGVDAGDESGAACSADSADAGFTCTAPSGGWNGGGHLDFVFDAGGSSAAVPACGAGCAFTTAVYEDSAGTAPATGTVTAEAETGLGLSLSAVTGGALTMTATNSGPTETADLSVQITGQGGYTITSGSGQCSSTGQGYTCDAGDTTGAVDTSDTWTVQFSGSTGPISMTASASATVYPGGTPDRLNGAAQAHLNWTPIPVPAPIPTGSGPAGPAPTPSPTVTYTGTGTGTATPKTTTKAGAAAVPKPKPSGSAAATAKATSAAGVPVAGAFDSTTAPGGLAAGPGTTTRASGGGGSNELMVALIGLLILVLAALGVWFGRGKLRRRHGASKPPVTPAGEGAANAVSTATNNFAAAKAEQAAAVGVVAPVAAEGPRQPLPMRKRAVPPKDAAPVTEGVAAAAAAPALAPEPEVAAAAEPAPEPLPVAVPKPRAESAAWESPDAAVAAAGIAASPATGAETMPKAEPETEPEPAPEQQPRAQVPAQSARSAPTTAAERGGDGESPADQDQPGGEGDQPAESNGHQFDPMNDTGPIRLDEFFTRRPNP